MLSNKPLTLLHEDRQSSNKQLEAEQFMAINQQSFAELLTFIEFADDFTIGFVEINYAKDTDSLIISLKDYPDCQDIQFLICNFDDPNLRFLRDEIIKKLSKITIEPDKKLVIIIRGLEKAIGSSGYYPPILQDLNYIRDAFTKSVPHPILLCLPDYAITRLAQFAPDFWAWRSGLFRFNTFYDFKSTQEAVIPKTIQFYITLNNLDLPISQERIELLHELLKEYPVSSFKSKQDIQNHLNILTQLGIAYRSKEETLLKSEEYLKRALELVDSYNSSISVIVQADILYELGVTTIKLEHLVSGLQYLEECLKIRKEIGDIKGTAETLHQIAIIYAKQGKIDEAINNFLDSLNIKEGIKDRFGKAETLNQMGIIYVDIRDFEEAIYSYLKARLIYSYESFPERWAMVQNNLGIAYSYRIMGNRSDNLEEEIACYNKGLQVYHPENFPEQWAAVQNNLANAYSDRLLGNRAENLELAISCYQSTLQVYTCEAFPEQWAETNNNLAVVYTYRIYGDRSENLEQAIACYQESLQIYSRENYPEKWAVIQNNLAVTYRNRIYGDRSENLERAITCYQNALEVYTREEFPEQWAMAQHGFSC